MHSAPHPAHTARVRQSMAVKKINIFDKRMRDQLMREVETLYSADCPWSAMHHPRPNPWRTAAV